MIQLRVRQNTYTSRLSFSCISSSDSTESSSLSVNIRASYCTKGASSVSPSPTGLSFSFARACFASACFSLYTCFLVFTTTFFSSLGGALILSI